MCAECENIIGDEKMHVCMFCEPVISLCEKCGGPTSKNQHEHPTMSLIADFDKYSPLLIEKANLNLN